jgi:predicted phage terminase large subunit-like protein
MNNQNNFIPEELFQQMLTDKKVRVAITQDSFMYFFHFYYAHYVKYATAEFQKSIINHLENDPVTNLFVVAFRGSGKSTIVTTAYPIWAILGKQQKKFVLILCETKVQAKQHMMNLRQELEGNERLKKDLGPFQEESDEWGSNALVFSSTGARITVASTEQSIRGLRHHQHRPDLIIGDDVESITTTKTREGRDKTYNWLKSDVIPSGDKNTRLIIVGNLLHENSLLMRINEDIRNGMTNGTFMRIPLIDNNEQCAWPGKYPTKQEIEEEKRKIGDGTAWQREFLLKILPPDAQIITKEIIQYYDVLPPLTEYAYRGTYSAVDLAISTNEDSDYTAIVSAAIFGRADLTRIYILPNPIIKKLPFVEQIGLLKQHWLNSLTGRYDKLFVENVAYQDAMPQMLQSMGVSATGVRPVGDKRTRLALIAPLIQSGRVKFPRTGAEELIEQLIGLGVEAHDDAADACSMLVNKIADIHFNEQLWVMGWIDNRTGEFEATKFLDYEDIEKKYRVVKDKE